MDDKLLVLDHHEELTRTGHGLEISEQVPARNIITVREIIARLQDIAQLHHFGVDSKFIARRNPAACDHQDNWLPESDATESTSLNIWV